VPAVAGRVHDPDGAGIDAVVTLVDHAGRQAARGDTDVDGRFRVGVRPGEYLVEATPRHAAAGAYGPEAGRVAVGAGTAPLDLVLHPRSAAPLHTGA
jgi:hypothetical protein